MPAESIQEFLLLLKKSPPGPVFNPWWQADRANDIGPEAPRIRREQLHHYLSRRIGTARFALIGEALGYRGGHFTGLAMTSERMLLGGKKELGIQSEDIFSGMAGRRTSKPTKCLTGFSEPTATIVWGTLLGLGLQPDMFLLWNAFPWHSFDPHVGMLSNRTPTSNERTAGLPVLHAFLRLFPGAHIIAIGRIAAAGLEQLNLDAPCVRHPASGGAKLFRRQIARTLANLGRNNYSKSSTGGHEQNKFRSP